MQIHHNIHTLWTRYTTIYPYQYNIHHHIHPINTRYRPSDFQFKICQFPFDIWTNSVWIPKMVFLPVFSHFHTKSMLAYTSCFIVMWLFSSSRVPGELFLIHFQRYVLTGSSVSKSKLRFEQFPVKTENHWLYRYTTKYTLWIPDTPSHTPYQQQIHHHIHPINTGYTTTYTLSTPHTPSYTPYQHHMHITYTLSTLDTPSHTPWEY